MSVIPYSSFQQDFRFEKVVGKGNCATVTQVYSTLEKKYFAHKLIVSTKDDEISQALNEVEALIAIDNIQLTSVLLLPFSCTTTIYISAERLATLNLALSSTSVIRP